MSGKEHTLRAEKYTYGGEVLARLPDGRAVFIPFAMPGELVRVSLVEEKRGYARARLVEILETSPMRIEPTCAHFTQCGGCHYQHIPYAEQLHLKRQVLKEQLERIGGLTDIPIGEPVPSPAAYTYRNHIQFHPTADGSLGLHRVGSKDVLPIETCHLPLPGLEKLRRMITLDPQSGVKRLGLRIGDDEEIQIILEGDAASPPEVMVEGMPVSILHLGDTEDLVVMAGSPWLWITVLGRSFRVSGGSFFQVNTALAGEMVSHVLETLGAWGVLNADPVIMDAYCGAGLFSAFLAKQARKLIGIEASPFASQDFAANLDEFERVELYEAPVEAVLPGWDESVDLLLVDPPRAGLHKYAMDGLLRIKAPTLVYVSCDPATLARDARRLVAGGYNLRQITPFDMFPQTYHIESISFWEVSQ